MRLYDLSRRVQNILRFADEEARARHAATIVQPHVLLGFFRDGGGDTTRVLEEAGVDIGVLETFVRRECLHEKPPRPPLFLPNDRLNLQTFDASGRLTLDLAVQEALNLGVAGVDTRRLVLGLAGLPDGTFAKALDRQGWKVDDLRNVFQPGFDRQFQRTVPSGLKLARNNLSSSVVAILERAWTMADQEQAEAVTERHIALGFLESGGRWTGGGVSDLKGLDVWRLRNDVVNNQWAVPPDPSKAVRQQATLGDGESGPDTGNEESPRPAHQPATPIVEVDREAEPDDDVFLPDGQLNRALFDERALAALDQAVQAALDLNHGVVGTPHLVIGLTSLRAGYTAVVLQQQGLPPEIVHRAMLQVFPPAPAIPDVQRAQLVRGGCSTNLVAILRLARARVRENTASQIGERDLLMAFLQNGGGHAGTVLEGLGLQRRNMPVGLGERLDTPRLDQFGIDLTRQARTGELGPVFGRDKEIQEVIEALAIKTKNNPLLVGEAGVGKTAIVEGLAHRIARGDVPEHLRDKRIIQIQMGHVVAGTVYRGQFEERIQHLLDEARQPEIILFIDEIHTLVGAGLAEGTTLDAGNLFKPALARSEVRVIGATTPEEASRTIERDAALDRRFYRIDVRELDRQETLDILRRLRPDRAEHYKVTISDDALEAAVTLSSQYVRERRLPDKAIEALDRACAKAAVGGSERKPVDAKAVAAAVAEWRNIPIERLTATQQGQLLQLREQLKARIIGQDEAVEVVARTVWRARTGLKDPLRPVGVLLFIGPTGVGKTELALALAELLHDSREAVIRLDMTEFQEGHTVSKLIGAPPGYAGYYDDGQLTGPLRRQPAAIVLLDEVDKVQTNTGVLDVFLQLFDNGTIRDGHGRMVDGRNALFIMTANVAPELIERRHRLGFRLSQQPETQAFQDEVQPHLRRHFRPEFLQRIDEIVIFQLLERGDGRAIVCLNLQTLQTRLQEQQRVALSWDEAAVDFLLDKGFSPNSGARALKRAITDWVEKPLSEALLHGHPSQVRLVVDDGRIVMRM